MSNGSGTVRECRANPCPTPNGHDLESGSWQSHHTENDASSNTERPAVFRGGIDSTLGNLHLCRGLHTVAVAETTFDSCTQPLSQTQPAHGGGLVYHPFRTGGTPGQWLDSGTAVFHH
mmetsp:Transcript_55243/g.66510  ORF Transcript_55243/g.66510 Transcript_55243/m.66510 type:complete len:118 (+) Transcript_55243:3028-3381(+)